MCNCPSPQELFRSIDARIDEGRWKPIGVAGATPWLYTVGLLEGFGHPELFVLPCCTPCGFDVLTAMAERVVEGERFEAASGLPEIVSERANDLVHLRPVEGAPLRSDWFAVWHAYYGSKPWAPPSLSVVQLVLPDPHGWFPWEPGCEPAVAARQQVPDEPPPPSGMNRAARRARASRPRFWR